ncbi:MAG: SpoIIE family protein phosphatase [Bacteroidota bacterium]|nr:SpoIIE family protein phosphatase [Bacteroidota bacterium]
MSNLYFFDILNKSTFAGLHRAKATINRKGVLFVNRMSILNTTMMLVFSIALPFLDLTEVLIFTIPFTILFAIPPYLNYKGYFAFCRYYFSILPLVFLTVVCMHNGAMLGDKLLILTTATIPLVLFRDKSKIYLMFSLNILVFLFITWYQSFYSPILNIPEYVQQIYLLLAQLTVFMVIFFVILYFRGDSEAYEADLEEKNRTISLKNTEIIDSITYAKRLQEAIMPSEKEIYNTIPESFILYRPKDIVAGDFYFAEQRGDHFFVAAADCTGHGVPGAMVSVVCSNALNRAVIELNLTQPGEILDKVTEMVVDTFKKSDHDVKDGMDISLCAINIKTHQIAWAGANNPLWYVSNDQLTEIKATKQPVGKSDHYKNFTTHILNLAKGSLVYLFTDGYADQFGGPKGKKFMYKQMADIILSNQGLEMGDQRNRLEHAFVQWKGALEQVDDVCIIGLRL